MRIVSNKGNTMIAIPIVVVLVFFMFTTFAVTFVRLIEPFIIYEKMSSVSLKYIFIMEEYGYLLDSDRDRLIEELKEKGLDEDRIVIRATSEEKEYGVPISLIINYQHVFYMPVFEDSFIPKMQENKMNLKIFKRTFSKR